MTSQLCQQQLWEMARTSSGDIEATEDSQNSTRRNYEGGGGQVNCPWSRSWNLKKLKFGYCHNCGHILGIGGQSLRPPLYTVSRESNAQIVGPEKPWSKSENRTPDFVLNLI